MRTPEEMGVDYKSAARRHFKDAELLHKEGRLANAGQLYGFNAECGLKALLAVCGVDIDEKGDIDKNYRKHITPLARLFLDLSLFPNGRDASQWTNRLASLKNFDDWDTSHRYWKESPFFSNSINKWQAAARDIEKMLDELTL